MKRALATRLQNYTAQHGWEPLLSLAYLAFLFVPLLGRWLSVSDDWRQVPFHWGATLCSVALFLPLYFCVLHADRRYQPWALAGVFVLGIGLLPCNAFANTYVIYAGALLIYLHGGLRGKLAALLLMQLIYGAWVWRHYPLQWAGLHIGTVALLSITIFFFNYLEQQRQREQAALKLTQDEVRRLASMAERERIGRDLHDSLGQTLSTVVLKAELAQRLADKDSQAAAGQMQQVAAIARDALTQMREAVSGIRSAMLAAELASAKILLEMEGIQMQSEIDTLPLSPEYETALALALREAVTNVQRHARASNVMVRLEHDESNRQVVMSITDDGRGGATPRGTGLAGMAERIQALGGQLQIESAKGRGTRLTLKLPMERAA
ncbi:two-component sensor histidine kinase [Lysobacteraceae bacterium NML95-0200]|nr:two-component sensor histidine kinase [Xanthomonadaceae bacterium NML95-0200]